MLDLKAVPGTDALPFAERLDRPAPPGAAKIDPWGIFTPAAPLPPDPPKAGPADAISDAERKWAADNVGQTEVRAWSPWQQFWAERRSDIDRGLADGSDS
ncbi:MAG TPA: hypothetical protein VG939_11190, partial [Caulobacteraceae bacterium]|nr:hypothetical protein [Caulobacteraceae bacterium]